jgi:hypothetical protein
MGKAPFKKQNFTSNQALNDLLNETAQGDTNLETTMRVTGNPLESREVLPTEAMPAPVQKVVNRDYRSLMQAIEKKKGR